jgi:hypothetical protein
MHQLLPIEKDLEMPIVLVERKGATFGSLRFGEFRAGLQRSEREKDEGGRLKEDVG